MFLFIFCSYIFGPWKKLPGMTQMGPGGFFPTNPDLADTLGRTDLNFYIFFIFWTPNFWISRSPDLKIQIRSAQNVGKVWISRKNILLALLGAI